MKRRLCVVTAVAKGEKWFNKFVRNQNGWLRQEDKWYDLAKGDTEFLRRKASARLAEFGESEEDTIVVAKKKNDACRSGAKRHKKNSTTHRPDQQRCPK